MARMAVVSGAHAKSGAAVICGAGEGGYRVAAVYEGNDEAAAEFKAKPVFPSTSGTSRITKPARPVSPRSTGDPGPVDIIINNAGITRTTMLHKMKPEQWYGVINTNLNSLFNMTRPVIEGMRERGFGRIVNISSINGQKGQIGQTNYGPPRRAISASPNRWRRKMPRRA